MVMKSQVWGSKSQGRPGEMNPQSLGKLYIYILYIVYMYILYISNDMLYISNNIYIYVYVYIPTKSSGHYIHGLNAFRLKLCPREKFL